MSWKCTFEFGTSTGKCSTHTSSSISPSGWLGMGLLASRASIKSSVKDSSLAMLLFILVLGFSRSIECERPSSVNIGAVLTYDSVIGRVAKLAIETAVDDINANSSILGGVRLNLIMENANCSVFLGAMGAFRVLENEVVALIGPQSSSLAHAISSATNDLQIPLISFAATDPTLSSRQFPYFLRTAQSDSYQMDAMADLIDYFGWKEVIAIFVDDDYGRNGISSLSDALSKKMSKIYYKIPLPIGASTGEISDKLNRSKMVGPRVYVVHANPDSGVAIFSEAQHLQMMTNEFVWFATDWLFAALDSSDIVDSSSLNFLQGVVGLRQYIPQLDQAKVFVSRWRESHKKEMVCCGLNTYGLYAYDTVWGVAYAINQFLNESGNITFSYNNELRNLKGKMQLEKLKMFDGGQLLRKKLLLLNFTGITGPIQFGTDQNLIGGAYEVINIDHSAIRTIGYWANNSGFSVSTPAILSAAKPRNFSVDQHLRVVTWPGGQRTQPRGWVLANGGIPLKIGIPRRVSYTEFVSADTRDVKGYCIDVFNAALKFVPYNVPHEFVPFGDGHSNPNYDELVNMVAENTFDAAVGDIAIVTSRTKLVDFTQPYIATGLVIVAPVKNTQSSTWVFLRPFTIRMWCVTGASFFIIGFVIWILEHRINNDFRGPPKHQLITTIMFSFSTLFKTGNEAILSTLGRIVMVVWLFLLMVITSSYTASLTSFLTVQQLSSPINGIESLIASNEPIGYQIGSYARSYLTDSLRIHPSRLVSLGSPEAYEAALQLGPGNGGVAAIIDELPYIEIFLSQRRNYDIVGPMFTKRGWGFAFPRDHPLGEDISRAILELSENGDLQRINKKWFCKEVCVARGAIDAEPNQLQLNSFWGLYLTCGIVTSTSFIIFLLRAIRQYIRYKRVHRDISCMPVQQRVGCAEVMFSFFDFIDEKEEAIKNIFRQQETSSQIIRPNGQVRTV